MKWEDDPLYIVLKEKYGVDREEFMSMVLSNPEWMIAMGFGYIAIMGFIGEQKEDD